MATWAQSDVNFTKTPINQNYWAKCLLITLLSCYRRILHPINKHCWCLIIVSIFLFTKFIVKSALLRLYGELTEWPLSKSSESRWLFLKAFIQIKLILYWFIDVNNYLKNTLFKESSYVICLQSYAFQMGGKSELRNHALWAISF